MQHYPIGNFVDLSNIRLTSPTCEDLGIPTEQDEPLGFYCPPRVIQNPSLHLDGLRYEAATKKNPFSPFCMIPLPSHFGLDGALEPAFIRKRNERERERVKCVNEGFDRLKERLPLENKDKRISKVEILRAAAQYIRDLHNLLEENEPHDDEEEGDAEENVGKQPPRFESDGGKGDNREHLSRCDCDDGGDFRVGSDRKGRADDGSLVGRKRRLCACSDSDTEPSPKRLSTDEDDDHAGREGPLEREFSDPDSSWTMSSDADL